MKTSSHILKVKSIILIGLVTLGGCKKEPIWLEILSSFQGKHVAEIERNCLGGVCSYINASDSIWTDNIEIIREGSQARIKYPYAGINKLLDFDSSFSTTRVVFKYNTFTQQQCYLTLDTETDSFLVVNQDGGMAGSVYHTARGKR